MAVFPNVNGMQQKKGGGGSTIRLMVLATTFSLSLCNAAHLRERRVNNCVEDGIPFLCNTQAGNACQLAAMRECCSEEYHTTDSNMDAAICGNYVPTTTPPPNCLTDGDAILCNTQAGNACQLKAESSCCSQEYYTTGSNIDVAYCGTMVMGGNGGGGGRRVLHERRDQSCREDGVPFLCNTQAGNACQLAAMRECCTEEYHITDDNMDAAICGNYVPDTTPTPTEDCVQNGDPILCNTQAGNACQLVALRECCSQEYYTTDNNVDAAYCGFLVY